LRILECLVAFFGVVLCTIPHVAQGVGGLVEPDGLRLQEFLLSLGSLETVLGDGIDGAAITKCELIVTIASPETQVLSGNIPRVEGCEVVFVTTHTRHSQLQRHNSYNDNEGHSRLQEICL
jgi:hypothetical protein